MDQVLDRSSWACSWGTAGELAFYREEFDRAVFPNSVRVIHPDFIVSVFVHTWAYVSTFLAMISVGGWALFFVGVNNTHSAHWRKWGAVEVEFSKHLVVSGDLWIDS